MKVRCINLTQAEARSAASGKMTVIVRKVTGTWIPIVEAVLKANDKWVWETMGYELTTPFGRPGDTLVGRETWAVGPCYNNIAPRELTKTLCPRNITYRADKRLDNVGRNHGRWRPSIHMPRRFSRMTLDVVEVRCEHLQDITVEDIIAEGLSTTLREHDACCDLRDQWVELWNSINAKRGYGWDTNPLVWVITFRNTTEEAKSQ